MAGYYGLENKEVIRIKVKVSKSVKPFFSPQIFIYVFSNYYCAKNWVIDESLYD